ncbi:MULTISPECIES: hypothetical protein [Mycobacterium]|uniref:hypothetical protein n=1 Tax=Mycobacterium TaxID=1763 RepID=UPI001CD9C44B|nr:MULTISPECIES: hypothetical protein [Mycobacterium]MCA2241699.1 hypothetical protein [Mycobacterium sp. WUMAC-067]MCA2312980.1 hypothetical protein [Mycobacterium sp. WUMAC-025]MEE3752408.1 hypothetical protein [Mycobacterium intracellulare]
MSTSKTVGARRRGLHGLLVGGLLTATAATLIALPVANADPGCNQDVGSSIDSYLQRHPDLHQQLIDKSKGEGGNGSVIDYLNRHPDVRQHLIELSHACPP